MTSHDLSCSVHVHVVFTIVYYSMTSFYCTSPHRQVSLLLCTVMQEYSLVFIKFCNFITVQLWVWVKQATETLTCLLFFCLFNQTFWVYCDGFCCLLPWSCHSTINWYLSFPWSTRPMNVWSLWIPLPTKLN